MAAFRRFVLNNEKLDIQPQMTDIEFGGFVAFRRCIAFFFFVLP